MTEKPYPIPDGESQPYWDGVREGRLTIQRCLECRRHVFYPRSVCPHCMGDLEWVPASGRGTVHSFSIVHRAPEEFKDEVPYVVALIDLEEGVRMMSRIVDAPEAVSIGLPVEVRFSGEGDHRLPVFKVVGGRA